MFRLKNLVILEKRENLGILPKRKLLINTINAHSYNTAQKDKLFAEALQRGGCVNPRRGKHRQGVPLAGCKIQTHRAYCRLEPVRVRDEQAEFYRRKMFFHGQ